MLQRTLRAFCSAKCTSVHQLVESIQRTPSYLRHAPPTLYITCDAEQAEGDAPLQRHTTHVIDASTYCGAPKQTNAVYVLSTSAIEDFDFTQSHAVSRVLVGLPPLRSEASADEFIRSHAAQLQHLHLVALPSINPSTGLVLKSLLRVFPDVTVACDAFGRAFLTDATFFSGVRRVLLENEVTITREVVNFAELARTRVAVVEDGAALPVSKRWPSPRVLRAYYVDYASQQHRRRHTHQHHPAHYTHRPIFFFDSAFATMHVGDAATRLPWLPHVLPEVGRDNLLPSPPLLATQHSSDVVLVSPWRVTETATAAADTLRKVPETQRVLASGFGELPGDVEDCALAMQNSADRLEDLRSRLARRLATDTSLDLNKWRPLLQNKIVNEILCTNDVNPPTTAEVRQAVKDWADHAELGRLATALTQAAMSLPPSAPAQPPSAADDAAVRSASPRRAAAAGPAAAETMSSAELEGAEGSRVLQSIFKKKGLGGVAGVLAKEQIDLRVFLAMGAEELRKVFKATYGVVKRLELLQQELRQNLT